MNFKMNFAWRIYRRLAQAFPHEFKLAYGTEVMQLGEDVVKDIAKRHGTTGLIRLIADIAMRVPLEYLSEMRGDMRYAWRALAKSPGFALVGILSMALGIGLSTNVYSSKWTMLFRDLPSAANAKHLVMFQESEDGDLAPVSYYYIEQYREQKSLFTGAAAFRTSVPFNVTFQGNLNAKPQRIFGQLVSPDYFSVIGVQPQNGRVLSPDLDQSGDAPVVVVSDRFWRNRLNSSPNAIGQTLHLNGQPATIVGITPKNFNGVLGVNPSELFVPITAPPALAPELANDVLHQRSAKDFLALLCLAPGVSMDSAEVALDSINRRLDEQDTTALPRIDKGRRVTLLPAGTNVPIPRKIKPVIIGFFLALMGLVLTLACMNLANMLMARGANRRKELAIRLAVGASRFRLVRQMISEGLLLSMLGGLAGFALAYLLGVLNSHFTPPTTIPVEFYFTMDWHAALFAFSLAILCGVGFSLIPALQSTKADLTPALKEGSALQLPGYRRFGLRNLLMVAQVAASLMLLLMTGFLVLGLSKGTSLQPKFDPNAMVLFSLDPVRDGYTPERAQALFEKLPDRLKASGHVRSVAMAAQPPFSGDTELTQVSAEAAQSSQVLQQVMEQTIGASYFATLNEPMLSGREFEPADQRVQPDPSKPSSLPAVLNESAAHKFFGNQNALGKRVRDDQRSFEVVGVVRDIRNVDGFTHATLYLPLTPRDFARPPAGGMTILVRSDNLSDLGAASGTDPLAAIRNEIAFLDPNLNIFNIQTLGSYLDRSRSALRFSVQTYSGIGVFGLVLAAIGLAGVTAYAVAQRRKEIAIRTAVGATPLQILRLVLREGAALISAGTILGFVGAMALAKVLSALTSLFVDALKIGTADPLLLVGAPLLLAAVAMLACYIPARKSTKIDPLKALREE
ncbi:MAG TPA: ADOP family duplicated permease [Candidatus Acidoferrum sp.]|nr:ADOP family duplicated permease [Candidatus Acidoferrum sp.]